MTINSLLDTNREKVPINFKDSGFFKPPMRTMEIAVPENSTLTFARHMPKLLIRGFNISTKNPLR